MWKITLAMIGAFLITGCAKTVWVHEKDTNGTGKATSIDGIPFYVKTEKHDQATKWSKTWVNVTLKFDKTYISEDPKEKPSTNTQEFTRAFAKDQLLNLSNLKKKILTLDKGNDETAKEIIDDFFKLPGLDNPDNDVKEVLISNSIKSVWEVDSSKTYYLNAPLPWFGSNTLSHELNQDGTLSKASSAPDTKVAEGISSIIPLKEYLTGKFVTPLNKESSDSIDKTLTFMGKTKPTDLEKAKFSYQFSIDISEAGYLYTFTKRCVKDTDCKSPIDFNIVNGFFVREPVSGKKGDQKKESDAKSISFQGASTLPKEDVKSEGSENK